MTGSEVGKLKDVERDEEGNLSLALAKINCLPVKEGTVVIGTINDKGSSERLWGRVEQLRRDGIDVGCKNNTYVALVECSEDYKQLHIFRRRL